MARKAASTETINLSFVDFFYDAVFAFTLASFAINIAFGWPEGKWSNFVQMLMLLTVWRDNVLYTSFVHAQDGLSRFFVFLSLLGVLGMAYHRAVALATSESVFQGYVVSFLWARAFQIVLCLQTGFASTASDANKKWFLIWAGWIAIMCIPAAVTLGLTSETTYFRVMIWLVGCGLDLLVGFIVPLFEPVADMQAIRADKQLRDRCGAFLLFLFANVLFAPYFASTGAETDFAGTYATLALSALIAFGFAWMYFDSERNGDDQTDRTSPAERQDHAIWAQLWFYAHGPLAMALVILGDASVQIVYLYRGIARVPNTVVPVATGPGLAFLRLSNTVQWIYGISFAIVLGFITLTGLLYLFQNDRHATTKYFRAAGRFALLLIMVLMPLAGLNDGGTSRNGLNPFVPVLVGALLLLVLVVVDWAFNVALAPTVPNRPKRQITVDVAPSSAQLAQLQERIQAQERDLAALRNQLADAKRAVPVAVVVGRGAEDVDKVESEMSSSKNWGFSSRSSSVVEDVVVSSDGDESVGEGGGGESASVVEAGAPAVSGSEDQSPGGMLRDESTEEDSNRE